MLDARTIHATLALALLIASGTGCGSGGSAGALDGGTNGMTEQLALDIATVRRGRILFGHHSVGRNVLAGLERLDTEAGGGRIRAVPLEEAVSTQGPLLAHGGVGRNGDPKGKVDDFARVVRASPPVDLAYMKFCYVDFEPSTDVEALLAHYQRTLQSLKHERPEIRFAHVTVPLTARPTDPKSWLGRLLGRELWEDAANARRSQFSQRLRDAFPSDPIFDLAGVEATGPDGVVQQFRLGGRSYPSMDPRNTDDGGHLNAQGQGAAAASMAHFLAQALRRPGEAR
jgi:hypothetical protein